MATASTRLTVGTVLATIGVAANSITTVLTTVTKGVSMVDNVVNDALEKQSARSIVDMAGFESALAEEKAQEMTERQLNVLSFCGQSAQHQELFATNYDKINALLAARHAKPGLRVAA